MRSVLAIVLMLVATGAGIAAASALVPAGSSGEAEPDHLTPGPAELLLGPRAADPTGPIEWGVRTYVSRTGLLCVERGRLSGPVFGDPDREGRVRARPAGPTGICGAASSPVVAGIERVAEHEGLPARTFVLGVSLLHPRTVTVTPLGETPVELPIGARGSFIGVFEGLREAEDLPLTVALANGDVTRIDWRG